MPSSGGSVSDAPIEKTVDGQHHQLAYITPNEAQTLVDQGGNPTMTNEGVIAYPPSDNYGGTHGSSSSSSNNSSRDTGSDYGQFDRAVSQEANNPSQSAPSGNDNNYQDRIQRISTGVEPGYRADDSRPFGLSKEEAYRQGKITVDQRDAEPALTAEHERDLTRDLDFEEHWNLAPKAIRWSPTLRFLYASGKNLSEWASKKGWTWNSGTGTITDNQGNNVGERDLMNTAAPDAPGLVSGQSNTQTTSGSYSASQWYANLGNTNTTGSNPFSFSTAFADAKAKQQTILGNPSPIQYLAVNESPFFNWLKENSLNKGIL